MRDDRTLLSDIHEALVLIARYTPTDRATLDADLPVQCLLIRYLQIVGEAAWRMSEPFKLTYSQVPWRSIAAMRHVLVHDYFRVDLNQVWNAATVHVPLLKVQIDSIVSSLPPAESAESS